MKLEYTVNARGAVKDIRVVEAVPEVVFEKAAVKAMKKWKFEPNDGENAAVRVQKTFDFVLDDDVQFVQSRRHCITTGSRICNSRNRATFIIYVNPPSS